MRRYVVALRFISEFGDMMNAYYKKFKDSPLFYEPIPRPDSEYFELILLDKHENELWEMVEGKSD